MRSPLIISSTKLPGTTTHSHLPLPTQHGHTEWERNLLEYSKTHPDVTVIDRVDGIRALQNRSTMLSVLNGEGIVLQVCRL